MKKKIKKAVRKKEVKVAKKKEVERETREKEQLTVWASPAWQLKKEGQEIKLISGCGFLGEEKEGLVELKVTVEEV